MAPKLPCLGTLVPLSLGLLLLLAPAAAATPAVTLAPEFSSGQLGGPGSVNATLKLEGTEYGGFPPPITQIALSLPVGTTLAAGTHATCSTEVLERTGPSGCRQAADAGPIGEASAIVSFGSERVEETATLQSFFAPDGGVNFFINGHSPVSLEMIAAATVAANVVAIELPLVSTVPGAPYASIRSIGLRLGETEAEEAASQMVSGLTLPGECPAGKSSWSATVTFDAGGANPVVPEAVEQGAEWECLQRQEALRIQRATAAQAKQRAEEEAAKKRRAEEAELVALRALVKKLQQELHASVKLGRVKVTGHGLLVTIRTSEPGILSITGAGLRGVVRNLPAGVHHLTVLFTKKGRAERGRHQTIGLLARDRVDAKTVTGAEKVLL